MTSGCKSLIKVMVAIWRFLCASALLCFDAPFALLRKQGHGQTLSAAGAGSNRAMLNTHCRGCHNTR
jgi:hypothetical protein